MAKRATRPAAEQGAQALEDGEAAAPATDAGAAAVFLTPEDLARRWRFVVQPRTLRNWRTQRRGPPWKEIGTRVLYALADVEAYERERDGQFLRR